jgi:hypothetical protein
MSDLKFVCPSCGQHIQCENAHTGENIPCPGCARLIRIPYVGQPAEVTSIPTNEAPAATEVEVVKPTTPDNPFDSEMTSGPVSYTSVDPVTGSAASKSEASTADAPPDEPKPAPEPPPVQPVTAATNNRESSAPGSLSVPELRCVCPVCQSELRIPMNVPFGSNGSVAAAERVIAPPAANHQPALEETKHEPVPLAERERKIAEARETQTVSAYPKMKPRLSVILNEDARTVTPADAPPPPSSSSEGGASDPPPPVKSLSE